MFTVSTGSSPHPLRGSSPIVGSLSHSRLRILETFRMFESFPTCTDSQPPSPASRELPPLGDAGQSGEVHFSLYVQFVPSPLSRSSPIEGSLSHSQLRTLETLCTFDSFSTCTIVQPPTASRSPPNFGGADYLSFSSQLRAKDQGPKGRFIRLVPAGNHILPAPRTPHPVHPGWGYPFMPW